MALAFSTMLPLGTLLPDFTLPDVCSGKTVSAESLAPAPGYLLMVICNHCPYVIRVRKVLVAFANRAVEQGVHVLALSANDAESYPEDAPDKMREFARNEQFAFPYLYDENQELVRKLQAVCTPEFYFFNASRKLTYRGQMDDSRPGNTEPNDASYLELALQAILRGKKVAAEQKPAVGCNIKWKPGNSPSLS